MISSMKDIVLRIFTYLGILLIVDSIVRGFDLNTLGAYLFLAFLMSITHIVLSPAIKFFTLPLNMFTFGFFNFIMSCIYLYFFNLFIPGFELKDGSIGPLISSSIVIPEIQMSLIAVIIFSSFLISLINNIVTWTQESPKKK